MFSSWYARRDAELLKGDETERLSYARELLAELLDRCEALSNQYHEVYKRSLENDGKDYVTKMDYEESRDWLLHSLGIFTRDADEALARARRARLVDGSGPFGGASTGCVDPDLEDLGGSLVPWHMEDAIAQGNVTLVFPEDTPKGPKRSRKAGG